MIRYIGKRLLWMIVVVVGVAVTIFTIMYFTPGDPAAIILGPSASAGELEAQRELMGLNEPYIQQLGEFLSQLFLHFDLGTSYVYNTSVASELFTRIPRTLTIAVISMLLQIIVGIPLGMLAAVKQNTAIDRITMFFSLLLVSIPGFWLALMLVLIFSLNLGWLPAMGIGGAVYFILPCISNAVSGVGGQARQSRSALLDVIRADYITTARAKGLSEMNILFRYALPNALIPLVTSIGGMLAGALGGAVIIETVFAIPGTGMYITAGIANRDYPVVRGSIVVLSIFYSFVILLTDIVYAFIDPKIKAQYETSSAKKKKKKAVPNE